MVSSWYYFLWSCSFTLQTTSIAMLAILPSMRSFLYRVAALRKIAVVKGVHPLIQTFCYLTGLTAEKALASQAPGQFLHLASKKCTKASSAFCAFRGWGTWRTVQLLLDSVFKMRLFAEKYWRTSCSGIQIPAAFIFSMTASTILPVSLGRGSWPISNHWWRYSP